MKRYFTLIIIMLLSLCVKAQLVVEPGSFKEVPGFVIIDHDKTDVNDIPYAVIKVRTQNINDKQRRELSFKGDMQTEIVLEYKDGEVWVYLTYLASYLKISHPDFSSTEFTFPYDMKPNCCYELLLVNKSQIAAGGSGTLRITTKPDGATIKINGREMSQKTPYYNEVMATGKYEIAISKERYKTIVKTVEISDNLNENINEILKSDVANITILSDSDAEIFIDGKPVGTGTWTGELLSGKHIVKCSSKYHTDVERTIEVIAENNVKQEIRPIPILSAVEISSDPSGATVYIDGKNRGLTPITLNDMIIGPHELKLEKTGCASITKTITLDDKDMLAINEKLQTGREVSISTDRSGDKLYADSNYLGISPLTATLTFGEHLIKAERNSKDPNDINISKDLKTVEKTISVSQGSGSIDVKLTFKQEINGHKYVDLGLPSGTLWATCNVGANSPEDYGNYYAWGETTTKNTYNWDTYKYCIGSNDNLTKYNTIADYGGVDNKKILGIKDDVASINWGSNWRMPTYDELDELKTKCTWTWTTQGEKNGYRVTGPNGKSIFLPAAGFRYVDSLYVAGSYGYYWSSSLNADTPCSAYRLYFNSGEVYMRYDYRYYGRSVRPVSAPQN